jgi:nucleoside phosphorylase
MKTARRIGVVCPSRFEYEALRGLAVAAHASVILSGMGKVRSVIGCHELCKQHPNIQHLLLIGFAGGLAGLAVGDVIEPKLVIEQDYCAEPFEKFPNQIRMPGPRLIQGSYDGTLLTQDRFLTQNPYANSPLAKRHKRLACDMEGYGVASFAKKSKLRCSIVKIISDAADETADHDFLKACRTLRPKLRSTLSQALSRLE